MIKTSGYRVSPTEVEEVVYATHRVGECAAVGLPHPTLGQEIVVIATPVAGGSLAAEDVIAACRAHLPLFMVPARVVVRDAPLPRNANGKIDRRGIAAECATLASWGMHEPA
jgi:acyl-CoA synthetase (AMP-forming)/AMP-acid ligase II